MRRLIPIALAMVTILAQDLPAYAGGGAGRSQPGGTITTHEPLAPPPPKSGGRRASGRYANRNRGVPTYFGENPDRGERQRRALEISGYVQPTFGLRYRPNGVPRDRLDYSAAGTRTGLIIYGEPIARWTYTFHLVATGEILASLRGESNEESGGGSGDDTPLFGAASLDNLKSAFQLEEVSIAYQPWQVLQIKVGQMRIPFTAQGQSPNTALMFPTRSAPNDVFLRGSDLGSLVSFNWREKVQIKAGLFNGSGLTGRNSDEQGLLYTGRIDVSPFGAFPFTEGDIGRGPFRLGLGAGFVYVPAGQYDRTGFETADVRDLRSSVSLRLSYRGLFFQGELLRRQRTDSLSSRPLIATGAYGQGSFYVPIRGRVGISPIARMGWAEEDESFDPRSTVWTELGGSLYIAGADGNPDGLRLTLHYLGERRVTERETAHGVVGQVQLSW